MSKEAMKLALEALEWCHGGEPCGTAEAITALREALAEQKSGIKQVIELYDSPDQPAQQEPVAWMRQDGQRVTTASDRHNYPDYETRYSIPLYTSPPAPRKPLTDDPLQGAVDWLLEADGEYFCTATVQRTLRIGYNRAKRLCDTAKERADQGIKGDT